MANGDCKWYQGRLCRLCFLVSLLTWYQRVVVRMQHRLLSTSRTQFPLDKPMFLVYNDKFNEILGACADVKLVHQETFPFAHEAGVYLPKSDSVYVTSNQISLTTGQEKVIVISKLTRNAYNQWTRLQVTNEICNPSSGIQYDDGLLNGVLFCSQGNLETPAGLVQLETEYPFRLRPLLNSFFGRRFNSVKDVAVHSDGSIWFTDPVYGHDQGIRPAPELPNQVYRFDPHTGDVRVMADGFGRPSGICFSPCENVCYISDTDFIHGDGSINFTRVSTMYVTVCPSTTNFIHIHTHIHIDTHKHI